MNLAIPEPLLSPLELRQTGVDVELLLENALLDLRDLHAPILNLVLDLASKRDRLLARFDLRLAPKRLRLSLCVAEQLLPLAPRAMNARPRPAQQNDGRRESSDEDSDERCAGREHEASSGGCRCPRSRPRVLSPGR